MAYDLNGTNQRIEVGSAPVTNTPCTMSCWFNANNITSSHGLITLTAAGNTTFYLTLYANGAASGDPIQCLDSGGSATASSATGFQAGTWHHACGTRTGTNNRVAYIDGVAGTANTNTALETGINEFNIGSFRTIANNYLVGRIAEVAIYDVALNASEVASLAKGMKPSRIRPQNLVFYAPLVRNLFDYDQARSLTNQNSATVASHPRIY
jgi:hypothetical protein